ncbi:MAG: hypothetical protein IJY52_00180 [Anaerotignum sp.]|nr:hypothetical protein [Anaerotignum sp.]
MKRRINVKLLLFFILLLIISIILLGILVRMEQGAGNFQAKLYGTPDFWGRQRMGPEGGIGMLALAMMAVSCYGIYKAFGGADSDETSKLQMPSGSCILLSFLLIGIGCVFAYLEWFRGYEFGRRYRGLSGIIFLLLGGLVLYRGLQGKEFRFWHKNWQSLDHEMLERKSEKAYVCPYCKNKLTKKEEHCPVCGRKID